MGSGQADGVSVALPPVQPFLTRDSFIPQGTSGLVWRHLRGHTGRGCSWVLWVEAGML